MTRLPWVLFALLLSLVLLPAPAAQGQSKRVALISGTTANWRTAPRVENVLIVVVDTLRADRLRAYAPNAPIASLAFDRLANDGQLFDLAYAHASWTKPSAATLLTGVLPSRHGATTHDRALDEAVPLLAESMAAAGYETGAFIANGYVSERFGFARGFDEFRNASHTGRARGDELVEDLLGWIDARDRGAPFFAYLHTTDVHAPYLPRAQTVAALDDAPYDGPIDFDGAPDLLRCIERGEVPLTARDRARLTTLYDAGVADHDELVVAPLLDGLAERDLLSRTLVVFTSDHGEELFDHGSVGHGGARVWEELIHVPLVIRWPGLAPSRIHEPVGLVSIAATVTDATGVPSMPGLDGASLVPIIEARRGAAGPILGSTGGLSFAVADRYKLVRSRGLSDGWIDLWQAPLEDASASDISAKRLARLGAALSLALSSPRSMRTPDPVMDEETLRRLRALGYVD